jgi:hypothetical protein
MRTTAERTCLVAVSFTLLGFTSSASASDAPFGVRATPLVVPQSAADKAAGPRPPSALGAAKTNVFFLNYDGAQVSWAGGGDDDSSQNKSYFQEFAGNYAAYGDGAKRTASFQAVLTDWAPYDVVITDQRPNGVYTMCINSPTNPFGGGVLGIAPLDCNDNNGRNIVFAFHSANDQHPAATQATTMSQELAHAFGLEHVSQPNDIMNPYNAGGDPKFLDQCLALDGGNIGIQCGQQHQQFCGGNQQNSHAELLWLFGMKNPDTTPPSVQITSPADGAMFNAGAGFTITATATDDVAVGVVDLFSNGEFLQSDNTDPFSWDVQGIPAGNYCFTATARDLADNTADSNQVCVTVVEGGDPPESTTSDSDPTNPTTDPPGTDSDGDSLTGGDDTGNGSNGDDDTGGDSVPTSDGEDSVSGGSLPGLPPDFGQEDENGGCRVAAPVPAASLMLLALLGLGRRRRR